MHSGRISFSVALSLIIDGLLPSDRFLAISPVDFKAKVTDMNGQAVKSANVTFFVDFAALCSNVTDRNGIARSSSPVGSGKHTWFASAQKDGEGGISLTSTFVVGESESLVAGVPGSATLVVSHVGEKSQVSDHAIPVIMSSSSALSEKLKCARKT
jgi:hypothetical protein